MELSLSFYHSPITMETWALFREILKAGVKEFGELRVFGRNVSMEGRLKSNVWLKFPDRYPDGDGKYKYSSTKDLKHITHPVWSTQQASCWGKSYYFHTGPGAPWQASPGRRTALRCPGGRASSGHWECQCAETWRTSPRFYGRFPPRQTSQDWDRSPGWSLGE